MNDKKVIKTIRFKETEIEIIEDFLQVNPALDFSTLIRLAVSKYIISPTLTPLTKTIHENKTKDQKWN